MTIPFSREIHFSPILPEWLQSSRHAYFNQLATHGLPTRKNERFRYLDLHDLMHDTQYAKDFSAELEIHAHLIAAYPKLSEEVIRFVFVNGHLQLTLSDLALLPDKVIACDLQTAFTQYEERIKSMWPHDIDAEHSPFISLNLASCTRGFFLYVPKGVRISLPIHFLHLSQSQTPVMAHVAHFIFLDEESEVTLFEEVVDQSVDTVFLNHLNIVQLEKNAAFNYTLLQKNANKTNHWHTIQLTQAAATIANLTSFALGGAFSRYDINAFLNDTHATCRTHGYYHVKDHHYVDHHIDITHRAPFSISDMLFKGTITDQAKAVFNGRLYVASEAVKIKAHQANHHLLFSNQAESYSKPELEIHADDVKCKHGATTASFNQEAIFYLRSRGFTESQAKALLLDSFVNTILESMILPPVFQEYVRERILDVTHDI